MSLAGYLYTMCSPVLRQLEQDSASRRNRRTRSSIPLKLSKSSSSEKFGNKIAVRQKLLFYKLLKYFLIELHPLWILFSWLAASSSTTINMVYTVGSKTNWILTKLTKKFWTRFNYCNFMFSGKILKFLNFIFSFCSPLFNKAMKTKKVYNYCIQKYFHV